jgi:large subunit ribosomal protein L5
MEDKRYGFFKSIIYKFMTQRLKTFYLNTVVPKLRKQLEYENIHQVPQVTKIVINCGLGEASQNAKSLESTLRDLSFITGQKPIVTRAKKSIAGFQIRAEMSVGVCVTLRADAMYAFLDRLIHLALPRIRDFQGLNSNSFDGHGNFHLGLKEQLMFPEIDYDKIEKLRGMDICIVTSSNNNKEALQLLVALGMPFQTTLTT